MENKMFSYIWSLWGLGSASPAFFPLFDQLSKLVIVPAAESDKALFLLLNTLFCSFVLLFSFLVQQRARSLAIPALLGLAGSGTLYLYITLVSPISALVLLGIPADVTYLYGFPELFYKGLYWSSFSLLTGAFTSMLAFFYTPRISRPW
jgi:hypothetical protein